jgi:beta-barrel assembly-enhancing protease
MRILSAAILSLALAAGAGRAQEKPRKPKDDPNRIGSRKVGNCLNFYSQEKELALGKQLAEEVQRQGKVNTDPLVSEYVNRVGQNLVRNSDGKVPFTFRVLDDDTPNAFALPGGYIFVHTGLIMIAEEEDELAGAMAHEIAHVAARHLTCHASKAQLMNLASLPLGGIFGGIGGAVARQSAALGLPAMLMSFSRADESEADYLGVQYMYAAGYDPNGSISIFEKLEALQRTKPGLMARVYSTHPMDGVRIEKTQQEIQRILPARPEYVVTTSEYREMRARLAAQISDRKDRTQPTLRVSPGAGEPGATDGGTGRPTVRRRELTDL